MSKHYLVIHQSLEKAARELFGNQFDYVLSEDICLPEKKFDQKESFKHISAKKNRNKKR